MGSSFVRRTSIRLKILLREDHSQPSHKDYETRGREGEGKRKRGRESIEREGGRTGNREGKTERKGREVKRRDLRERGKKLEIK